MNTRSTTRMHAWPWMLMLLWTWGCSGPWPASGYKRPPLSVPADAELATEISPQQLLPAQPPPAPEAKYFTHTVRDPGETFIAIARWYTANGNNWTRLAQANPDTDPQRIRIGDVIRIPEEIVTTRRPMPRSAPSATVAGKKRPPPAPRPNVELFGPIETDSVAGQPESDGSRLVLETLD
jgi:LysM domain